MGRGAQRRTFSLLPFSATVGRSSKPPKGSVSRPRVASVMSTTSPVTRVTSSTRAAVLTASPMTVNSTWPPPPTVPASTGPEFTPMPMRSSPP